MRTVIIGDVHGCVEELTTLLDLISPANSDHIVFVGDLIHRGPDSGAVVRKARTLAKWFRVTLVEGNHEEKHNRWRHSPHPERMRYIDEYPEVEAQLDDEDRAFLESGQLFVKLPEHNAMVLHGGVLPTTELPDEPPTREQLRLLTSKQYGRLTQILRVRWVSPEGKSVKIAEKQPDSILWPQLYDGRFGHIYFGHHPFAFEHEPKRFEHATGIDLGCVFGGRLAAVILEPDQPPRSITVKAERAFAELLLEG